MRRFLEHPSLDAAFRVLVVISFMLGAWAWVQARQLAVCQQKYNDSFNLRSKILTESSNRERASSGAVMDANAALWLSPLVGKPREQQTAADRAELLALFADYQRAIATNKTERAEADRLRAENPVPPPPSQTCG